MERGQMSHILISVNGLPTTVLMLAPPLMVSVNAITPIYRQREGRQKGAARKSGWKRPGVRGQFYATSRSFT
ncbi:hypothetical protein E2C01_098538 [Portunus trituberculatus]|uniref:Uncharacterized protein n=1 Tax=Portunus trituberculatus TaxID=210409 RepID=A0A5B7KD62_PORTR|nr:hypothetical protein [Portunus trituberculatus]